MFTHRHIYIYMSNTDIAPLGLLNDISANLTKLLQLIAPEMILVGGPRLLLNNAVWDSQSLKCFLYQCCSCRILMAHSTTVV